MDKYVSKEIVWASPMKSYYDKFAGWLSLTYDIGISTISFIWLLLNHV